MLEAELAAFLETGCALIVALVDEHGAPYATRGWGAEVVRVGGDEVRLLLGVGDACGIAAASEGAPIAVTATSVRTLRSVQLKGHVVAGAGAVPGAERDRDRCLQYCERFFTDIGDTDGTPRQLLDRLRPTDVVACTVRVEELFDQTPGPAAGRALPPQAATPGGPR